MWLCAFGTDQAAVSLITAIHTEVLVDFVVLCASYLDQHFAVGYALDGASSCHVLAALAGMHVAGSVGDLGLSLAVDELISNEKFLIVVAIVLHKDEMPKIVKDCSFGAGRTDYLILHLHFSKNNKKGTNCHQQLLALARTGSMDGDHSVNSKVLGLVFCRCCIYGNGS